MCPDKSLRWVFGWHLCERLYLSVCGTLVVLPFLCKAGRGKDKRYKYSNHTASAVDSSKWENSICWWATWEATVVLSRNIFQLCSTLVFIICCQFFYVDSPGFALSFKSNKIARKTIFSFLCFPHLEWWYKLPCWQTLSFLDSKSPESSWWVQFSLVAKPRREQDKWEFKMVIC